MKNNYYKVQEKGKQRSKVGWFDTPIEAVHWFVDYHWRASPLRIIKPYIFEVTNLQTKEITNVQVDFMPRIDRIAEIK